MVRSEGLEPIMPKALVSKTSVSTISPTSHSWWRTRVTIPHLPLERRTPRPLGECAIDSCRRRYRTYYLNGFKDRRPNLWNRQQTGCAFWFRTKHLSGQNRATPPRSPPRNGAGFPPAAVLRTHLCVQAARLSCRSGNAPATESLRGMGGIKWSRLRGFEPAT